MSNQQPQSRVDELQALFEVSRLINVVDLDKVLLETLTIVSNAVGAQKGSLLLIDSDGKPYQRFLIQRNLPPEVSRNVVNKVLSEGLASWAIKEKRGTIVKDALDDERWLKFEDDDQTDVRSVLVVPFVFEDTVHGVMTLANGTPSHFTPQDLEIATAIANQASSAIRNAHLFDDIQNQQRQLARVLENIGDPIFLLDANFQFLQANHYVADMLGVDYHELLGMKLTSFETKFAEELIKHIQSVAESGEAGTVELRDTSNQHDYYISVAPIEDQKQMTYVVVLKDITIMRDLDRLKSHMLRMASHDLKNPLGIMMGYVELIRNDVTSGETPDIELVDGAMRSIRKMDKLIEELLDAKRIERETQFRGNLVHPRDLIIAAIEELSEHAEKKKLKLVDNIALELPPISGDSTQLRQAMINLISNAIKYTPSGGIITVHASADGNRFHFSVEDTGIGIPEDLQDGIFEQLYRAVRPDIEDIEGTGVGLSLVKEIIERHKGQVWFRSTEGQGSVFGLWLPIQ